LNPGPSLGKRRS